MDNNEKNAKFNPKTVLIFCVGICIILLLIFFFVRKNNSPEKLIIGDWLQTAWGGEARFYEDGTFWNLDGDKGTYSFMNGRLVVREAMAVSSKETVYDYKFDGPDHLILHYHDGDKIIDLVRIDSSES